MKERITYWEKIVGNENIKNIMETNSELRDYLLGENIKNTKVISKQFEMYIFNEEIKNIDYIELEKEIHFKEFYFLFIKYGISQLKSQVKDIKKCWDEKVYIDFANHLAKQLQLVCIRILITKMHENNNLEGDSPKEEYDYFCSHILSKKSFIYEIFVEYPVLLYCIERKVEFLVEYYVEIFKNYFQDKKDLQKNLFEGKEIYKITKIAGGFSDVHNKGKQVLRVTIDNNEEVLYKPRNMYNEKAFAEIIQWLGERIEIDQYMYSFISYDDHSWSKIVTYSSCDNYEQLCKYYLRLGVQLFVTYILNTKDLHYENLIAAGEYPVLVDLETLVNVYYNCERETVKDEIYYKLSKSVLFTGILPYYSWNYDGKGVDNSALRGGRLKRYPFKIPVLDKENTSNMEIVYKNPLSKKQKNLATINGIFREPVLYREEILEGFKRAYVYVMKNKEVFKEIIDNVGGINNRYLLVDTQRYSMLLSSSFHPSVMKSMQERELLLNAIRKGRENVSNKIIEREIKHLIDGDVPYFHYQVNDTSLNDMEGEIESNFFKENPFKLVIENVDSLNSIDLTQQCEFIELSLILSNRDETEDEKGKKHNMFSQNDRKEMSGNLKTIDILLDRIIDNAIWNRNRTEVGWGVIYYNSFNTNNWAIKPMGYYLYNGLSGMLLLFGILSLLKKETSIRDIFSVLKKMLFQYTDRGLISLNNLQSKYTGAYEGESSIVYTYLVLYKITKERIYLEYAERHASIVGELVGSDKNYDVLFGNAGATIIFLHLFETTQKHKYLDISQKCVDNLISSSKTINKGVGWIVDKDVIPMAGMAHGNAGILWAILLFCKKVTHEKYIEFAKKIICYENTLYNSEQNNWRDTRIVNDNRIKGDNVAWCHGAAGILLSRLEIYKIIERHDLNKSIWDDIIRSLKKTKANYKRESWCLCHGTLGNLWILKEADRLIDLEEEFAQEMRNIKSRKINLLPQEILNPGLMNGYGGIIYFLLQSENGWIPNILKLEI